MQDKQTANPLDISNISLVPNEGRIIALDLGTKKVGAAVTDELQVTARPLEIIPRRSWKELLKTTILLIEKFDAVALVIGLPYNFDGSESEMSQEARRLARNFSLSISIPVFLQDERLSTKSAQQNLYDLGHQFKEILKRVDSEAATIILGDFLALKDELKKRKDAPIS